MMNLAELLKTTCLRQGERTAIYNGDKTISYIELERMIAGSGGALAELGIEPGMRYGVICRNSPECALLFFGGYRIGAIPTPVNFRLAPPEIAFILSDAGVTKLFVEDVFLDLLKAEQLAPWRENAVLVSGSGGGFDGPIFSEISSRAPEAAIAEVDADDEALLIYTGGTSGRSKGVRLSHKNIITDLYQTGVGWGARSDDIYLHLAPMFHSADLAGMTWYLHGGGHVYLPAFTPASVLETIEKYRITATMMPPTMLIMALSVPNFADYDLSCLRHLIFGASPITLKWIKKAIAAFPNTSVAQNYGLTETAPILASMPWAVARDIDDDKHLESCGRALVGVELKIVDDADGEVPAGEAGEIVARAGNVMLGYLNMEEETARVMRGGWFHTGDVGCIDEDGYLYLLDRKKDMIISGGENIYSSEVEEVLNEHPAVGEAAVIGLADEKYGETLLAVIVAAGPAPTADELLKFCRGKIGGYKIPRRYEFVEVLPKSAMGKVLKTELRKQYSE